MEKLLKNAEYGTISNDLEWYEGFPDITLTKSGEYLCIFRRSIGHFGLFHSLFLSRSKDGINWNEPLLFEGPRNEEERELWNAPKIQCFQDGHLEVTCDYHDLYLIQEEPCIFTWHSNDDGKSWFGPKLNQIFGIMPSEYIINPENPQERILGLHYRDVKTERLKHVLYRSFNNGQKWWAEEIMAADGVHDYCEGTLVAIPINYGGSKITAIFTFLRDNTILGSLGSPMQFSVSYDFGRTWKNTIEIPIYGHRPVANLLNDGRIMISYRDVGGCLCTAIWIAEINTEMLKPSKDLVFNQIFKNQHKYIIEQEENGTSYADYGYTGWIQNPISNEIVLVYYTRKNSPNCYVKSVKFNPEIL